MKTLKLYGVALARAIGAFFGLEWFTAKSSAEHRCQMKDGRVTVTLEAGDIVGVSVNTALDLVYERLFNLAVEELQGEGSSPEVAIRLIVFGCFWLEALCNETLRDLLQSSVSPEAVAKVLWGIVERAPFLSKFATVSAFAKNPDPNRVTNLAREMKQVFDLRNRLAHFKDKDTEVAGRLTPEEFEQLLGELPDAELAKHLKPPLASVHRKEIQDGVDWLREIHQQYFQQESRASDAT